MKEMRMGEIEAQFADIIWQNEPVSTGALIQMSEQALGWNRSTTYTVLRRLCEKGIFQMQNGTVTSLVSKGDFYAVQSEKFVQETFGGSLPSFLAAFSKRKQLSEEEIDAIRGLIEAFEKGEPS